jgi:hypothetical protein
MKATQEQVDLIMAKSTKEQVEFLFDIINEGKESLLLNKDIIKDNFQKMFHLITMECMSIVGEVSNESLTNTNIENLSDEEGKAYMRNKIVDNVTSKMLA